jgi:tRNA threonylcarbamoyladenosine biosynthesis protein TsaB
MTPLILAVDTTREYGSLALARGGEPMEEALLHSPSGFAHVLFGALEDILRRAAVKIEEIDLFASASGPGSFTGVRIGLSFAKGLAEAMGKPAVAVSNLRALASFGSAALSAPLLDARRGEIYGAVYGGSGELVREEGVAPASAWLERLPAGDLEFVCVDEAFARSVLAGTAFESARVTVAPRSLAGAIARVAADDFAGGRATDPAALDANYVRRSDAELFWKG